jgi:ABC-2 type transport system permease protein
MRRFLRRAAAIAHKEMLQMVRDVRVLFLALGLPVVMLFIFGYAVSLDIEGIPLAVLDQDATRDSRELAEALAIGGTFERVASPSTPQETETLLRRGVVKVALVIPRAYSRALNRGDATSAQLLIDGSDGTTATMALNGAAGVVQARRLATLAPLRPSLTRGAAVRALFNPAMRSAYAIVPGAIALILTMLTTLLSALTVAREWERGSMEQLLATPVSRAAIILGKLMPFAALGMVQTLLALAMGAILFRVPVSGSLGVLALSSTLFLLSTLGMGLFLSVATKNQAVSVQLTFNVALLPTLLLSGFLFPIENMPWPLRALSAAVPARYYVSALRGVLLKGSGIGELILPIGGLALFAVGMLTVAVVRFRRRLT